MELYSKICGGKRHLFVIPSVIMESKEVKRIMRLIYHAFSVFLLVVLGTVCARADNILTVNGTLHPAYADLNGGFAAVPSFYPFYLSDRFSWTDTYIDYSGTQRCTPYVCRTDYTANFDGGVLTGTYTIQSQTYLLQAHIVSGYINGISCVPEFDHTICPPGGNQFQAGLRFVGVWNNGWLAIGDIFVTGNRNWGVGQYTINTQSSAIPEPSTFLLLGSGALTLAGVVRRRLGM
jgi:hypothetical protein